MRLNLILSTLCLCCVSILFTNCKKEETDEWKETSSLYFHPRVCSQVLLRSVAIDSLPYQRKALRIDSSVIDAQRLGLWMMTAADDILDFVREHKEASFLYYPTSYNAPLYSYKQYADGFPKIEKQLSNDYLNYLRSFDTPTRSQTRSGLAYLNLIPWEYRVTGVKDFNIVATTPLFGLPAGTSLNRHFSIFEFRPKQIISYRTNSLVWGYRSKNKVETIDQWLALKPMAPPAIVFRLKETPPEVPTRVQFVSILETTDGKVLRDTTEVNLK